MKKDMTQKEFADATGITPNAISDWKRKKTNPASDKIMLICDVLGVSPYELLLESGQAKYNDVDYVVVDKNSKEYALIERFEKMDTRIPGAFVWVC